MGRRKTKKQQMKGGPLALPESRQEPETVVPEWKPERQIMTTFEVDYKGFYKSEGSMEMRIDRFAEFVRDGSSRFSAPIYIRGLLWYTLAYSNVKSTGQSNNPNGQSPSKDLAVYLCCKNDSINQRWECQATYTLSVKAQKEDVKDIIRGSVNKSFNGESWGYRNFATCDVLLDPEKGYIKDDVVILQANVRVTAVSRIPAIENGQLFSSSTEYAWDFVLLVEETEIYVLKSHLAMHSKYFKNQFARHKRSNKAILEDVDYDGFIELLTVIYPTLRPINVKNVETISKLAFQFEMAALLKQCETFLMEHSKELGRARALLMAEWYGLVNLPGKIIDEIENVAVVKEMKPDYDALSHQTKRMIFDKICSPVSVPNPVSVPEERGISISRATEILQELSSSVRCASDGVLIVKNQRIPIHKMYLAVYSEYFEVMFQGEFAEGNMDEIVLEEVGYREILELLAIIYPTKKQLSITDTNVGTILKMADRFIMPSILARCEKLLQDSTQIRAARKLWLAQRYNLPDLQEEYAQKYRTVSDVTKLKAEPEFGLLDDETRALILDSIISS